MDNLSEIKDKIEISDFIGRYVQLKRAGKNYKGLCPFHNEKTPSFIVSPDIQRYRCFGCGKSGDIFNFVMDYEGMEFGEALKFLAEKAGVEIKEYKSHAQDNNKFIFEVNTLALKFYNFLLTKHKAGEFARNYLKERGVTEESIKTFYLGYAPNSWESLSKFLKTKKYKDDELIKSGVSKGRKSGDGSYDIFRNRIVFPFIDHLGRPVGFSARALEKDQNPKYINTPETPIFRKEKFLFGLNLAKKYIKEDLQVIIVEGMMDMLSLYQNGYKNVVASGGTALTPGQINLLKRYTDTILLIFDNDTAGQEAMLRGIHVIKNAELKIKIGVLPEGIKDPDDLMKSDPKKFEDVKKESLPLWDYYMKYAFKKFKIENTFERKDAYYFLVNAFNQIPDNVTKSNYAKKLSEIFEMPETEILKDMISVSKIDLEDKKETKSFVLDHSDQKYNNPEVYFLSLLFQVDKGSLDIYLQEIKSEYFLDSIVRKIYDLFREEVGLQDYEIKAFYDKLVHSYPETNSLFERIYLLNSADLSNNSAILHKEISIGLKRLKKEFYKRELKKISIAIKKAEVISDQSEVEALLIQADQYREFLKDLGS